MSRVSRFVSSDGIGERSTARMESPLLQTIPDTCSNMNSLTMRLPLDSAESFGGLFTQERSIMKPFVVGPLADTLVEMIPRVPSRGVRRQPVVMKSVAFG